MHGWIEGKHCLSCEKRKTSSIKCKIKTEGGHLQKAEQPVVEGAPASRCVAMGEFLQTNDRVKDGRGWQRHTRGNKDGRTMSEMCNRKNKMSSHAAERSWKLHCTSVFSV